MRALVIGSVSLDTNIGGGRRVRKLGGAVTYAGLTLRRLGVKTIVVTSIGRSDVGRLELLRAQSVVVVAQTGRESTTFVNETDGDRRVQRIENVAEPIEVGTLRQALSGADLVILGALHPADMTEEALRAVAEVECPVAADIQGYVRSVINGRICSRASPLLGEVLCTSGFVKAEREEMRATESAIGCDSRSVMERFGIDEMVITDGSHGGEVLLRTGSRFRYEAVPAARIQDATGAGDVFFAAFLHARLVKGETPERSAATAAVIASSQVSGGFITEDQLKID